MLNLIRTIIIEKNNTISDTILISIAVIIMIGLASAVPLESLNILIKIHHPELAPQLNYIRNSLVLFTIEIISEYKWNQEIESYQQKERCKQLYD